MKIKILLLLSLIVAACSSDVEDLIELADGVDRKTIDTSRIGVNNFFVDREFGSIAQQHAEIRNTLGIRFLRVLFSWNDAIQPTPGSTPNFSFYDDILASAPADSEVLIVVNNAPSWMINPSNHVVGGNPRATWVELWLKPVVARYNSDPRVIGYEIWNEPDLDEISGDAALVLADPVNYFELLSLGAPVVKAASPQKLVLNAATESINQEFPGNLNYNKTLVELGALNLVDVYNIHYYGQQFERVIGGDGIADFLNGLGKLIWLTESGEVGVNNQLKYVEETWPFLRERIGNLDRIYYYQYGETLPQEHFGLKTTNPEFPVSDLYVHLRDRAAAN